MKTLVLGGNGFIGSHLVDELILAGHQVRVFGRTKEKFREPLPGVEYFAGEFSDTVRLATALNGVELVYHLISTTVPATSNIDPIGDINGNLVNTVKLLDLMVQQSVPRIVYLSSGGTVYGNPAHLPIPETHPLNPISSYGIIKGTVERYLHMYSVLHPITYTSIRASNPYGTRQSRSGLQGIIGTYLDCLYNGRTVEIWGDGKVVRDYIHVSDVVRMCLHAAHSDYSGTVNAGSGVGTSILELVEILSECTGIQINPKFKPGRSFDVPKVILDISRAKRIFDWQPEISLRDGINLTLPYVDEITKSFIRSTA